MNLLEKKGDFGRREKRKRITKDKVDLNQKPAPGAPRTDGRSAAGGPGSGGGSGRGSFRDNNKKRGPKGAPKPAPVHTEVSEEEVQKQIKDTLARLTSKGSKFKTGKQPPRQARCGIGPYTGGTGTRRTRKEYPEGNRVRYRQRARLDDGCRRYRRHYGLHEPRP